MRIIDGSSRTSPFSTRPLLSLSSFILAMAVGIISSFTYTTAYDMARSRLYAGPQMVAGVWRGQWQGVPAVTVKLEQQGESLSGTASFVRVINTEDGPEAGGTIPEIPLVNPRLQGKTLSFEFAAPDDIHPTMFIEMEMSFENEEEAALRCVRRDSIEVPVDKEPAIRMRRER